MKLMTNSRLSAARRCQRFHHIKYNLGLVPHVEDPELRFGTLIHKALEVYWNTRSLELALEQVHGGDPYDMAKAIAMLSGYASRWEEDDKRYETISVEWKFETELVNPETGAASKTWRLAGKLDVLVKEISSGEVFIIEHKTSSSDLTPGSDYWKRLRMDGQVSTYYEGAKSAGHDVKGVIYDVLGKPKIRPLEVNSRRSQPETPEEYLQRCVAAIAEEPQKYLQRQTVVRLEQELEDFRFDIWQLGQQLREAENAKRAPRNPDACTMYNRTCPYFAVCTGEASLDSLKKEQPNVELRQG